MQTLRSDREGERNLLDKLKNLYKAIKERKLWPIIAIIAFLSSVFLFYWIDYISPKAMDFVLADSDMHNIKAQYVIGEICSGDVIEQQIPGRCRYLWNWF